MNADSYFEIGSAHVVCEDYALSGVHEDLAYAIVCDGCSSSKHSDVGARLLAHIAKDALIYMHQRKHLYDREFIENKFKDTFQEIILKKCIEVQQTLKLDIYAFDATLLLTAVINGEVTIMFGRGDGYFVRRMHNGDIVTFGFKYASNAPFYLSYDMFFERERSYHEQFGAAPVTLTLKGNGTHEVNQSSVLRYDQAILCETYYSSSSQIAQIGVTSDGVDTYEMPPDEGFCGDLEPNGIIKLDPTEMMLEMTNYKNPVGEFVKRRLTKMRKDSLQKSILHQDDISFAAINLLES